MGEELRLLTETERRTIERAREIASIIYEGKQTPHRSCGIAIAEVFGCHTASYQSLRRGGITGEGGCGAIKAGELILGEILGDPEPAGPVTDALRDAAFLYRRLRRERLDLGPGGRTADGRLTNICNDLVRPQGDFHGPRRHGFCTQLTAEVAALAAEALLRSGRNVEIPRHLAGFRRRQPAEL